MHAFESLPQRPPREPRDLKRRHRDLQPDPPITATAAHHHDNLGDSLSNSSVGGCGALLPAAVCAPPAAGSAYGTASSHLEPESASASAVSPTSANAASVAADASSMSDEADSLATRHSETHCGAARFDADGALIIREHQWEYLDHPADVQIHAWGASFAEAFEHAAIGMFAYMTPLERVDCRPGEGCGAARTERFECDAHDLDSLLFNFLDALLFTFSTDLFVCREIHIEEFDAVRFRIRARGFGEEFDFGRHEQGTEIKAITYSNMQVSRNQETGRCEVYVIVDI